jgi:serine/threonine protein kinase
MPFVVPIADAAVRYPEYVFVKALTPSEQKAAFHVRDSQGQDLCLKIISPDYDMDRLKREIIALQAIQHPNGATIREYTFSSRQGWQRHHIIEEFVDGNDLFAHIGTGQPWDRPRTATFFAALCDGLDAIGKKAIVHRDLKPTNIRVRIDGSPVIIDLGVARHLTLTDITNTGDGAQIGTPLYFAPEQVQGTKHEIDHRTDLFAVGIMLYEALVGRHPFWTPGQSMSLSEAICHSDEHLSVAAFQSLPPQWQLLVTKLLNKERADRPHSADQAAHILRKIGGI